MTTTNTLDGRIILIVEDEYFIAADLRRALQSRGAEVLGPVSNLRDGLRLCEAEQLDAAILDVNLDGVLSFPIADRLAERAVPWTFLTGYDDWALPDAYRVVPRVAKPFRSDMILSAMERLLHSGDAA
ncbi:response regulator [Sphingomonas metalli]|uniref:Response regulator n=1 Tax=Sphingomonas metalli TaxID=1779358 RepID=A0A916SUA3_9SPHN|nr:response regulator [Sphingomonas metalli]GGB16617.1 response regulator [Sphingomonas metalli]